VIRRFSLAALLLAAALPSALAEPGDQAAFDRGSAAYDEGRYEDAFAIFDALADSGDLAAMRNVALMLRRGQGAAPDPKRARAYLLRAARRGLTTAQADLGIMLLDGEGGEADPKEALPWIMASAAAGHALAQYHLGRMYEDGLVVPKDLAQAKLYYGAAAARGYRPSASRLADLLGLVPEKEPVRARPAPAPPVPPREPPAATAHKTWIGPGDPLPEEALTAAGGVAKALTEGREAYLARNFKGAAARWRRAADADSAEGQFRLGHLYLTGEGVPFDPVRAAEWFAAATAQGHASAERALSKIEHGRVAQKKP